MESSGRMTTTLASDEYVVTTAQNLGLRMASRAMMVDQTINPDVTNCSSCPKQFSESMPA